MFTLDKRFEVSFELPHSFTPIFNLSFYIGREPWVKINGTDHFITVKIKFELNKTS